jgi:hypothetical protein
MVQPSVARIFMADPLAVDTGFLPRFLICEPQSTIGSRLQANTKHNDIELEAFGNRLRAILEIEMPMDAETRELQPRVLGLASDARELVAAFSDAIEQAQGAGGSLAHITGTASKIAEQACRIAGVLTLWQDINADEVKMAEMEFGVALAKFYLSEASRLASAAIISNEINNAEKLRRWLLERWAETEVLVRDVVQLGPNSLRETPKARAALGILEKHGWLVALESGTVVREAARKEAWRVVRRG